MLQHEDDDADHNHLPVADGVCQAAPKGEQRRQGQQVGVDHPLHPCAGQAKLSLDLRHGDGHDGLVDERHRDGEDHRRQDPVLRSAGGGGADGHHSSLEITQVLWSGNPCWVARHRQTATPEQRQE